ncbi:MotA/TolQ/ExbB proton channel family protein [Desulfosarcina sp. OttesenSCG-928-A07]|nr:MotA/TolQ/ExbB proton channel family protein [Desulfosarcina sp. OttesenSCG-928-G17]MDL2329645.1 MotA/TolQ/ExbB proton channel family protein [Desulfosarcina sp. OttesenSCG-928-A07]
MHPNNISIERMFLDADPVVQGVMIILLLASVLCWAIFIEKAVLFRKAAATLRTFNTAVTESSAINRDFSAHCPGFTASVAKVGVEESLDDAGHETREAYRGRLERAMSSVFGTHIDLLGRRALFLATVGSVSPFIGLLGTVWGIMHSFMGIAASGETSLAVVAPGIAEALFATAIGLVAAIPAVIGFNKISSILKALTKEGMITIGLLGNKLAKQHFTGTER